MKKHLSGQGIDPDRTSRHGSSSSSSVFEPDTYSNYDLIFKERFCLAASHLAASMSLPLNKLGILYDNVIETGTLSPNEKVTTRATMDFDVEAVTKSQLFGTGQVLFLVRQVTGDEEQALLSAGFRFAEVPRVGRNIAQTMQIPLPVLDTYVISLKRYIYGVDHGVKSGSWISFFGMLAKPHNLGFDVVVKKDVQDQLPDARIRSTELSWDQQDFLGQMNDKTAPACIDYLVASEKQEANQRTPNDKDFARQVLQAIEDIRAQVPDVWFKQAVFYARKLEANYTKLSSPDFTPTPVYAFYCIADFNVRIASYPKLDRVPLPFFTMRQRVYAGSKDLTHFEADACLDFATLFSRKRPAKSTGKSPKSKISAVGYRTSRRMSTSEHSRESSSVLHTESSDDTTELVQSAATISDGSSARIDSSGIGHWGGILVNSETVVEEHERVINSMEMRDLGTRVDVTAATRTDERTFVDELAALCKAKYYKANRGGWTLGSKT